MSILTRIPFRTGLTLTLLITCLTTWLLTSLSLTWWQYNSQRASMLARHNEFSVVVAANLAAALVFADDPALQEMLSTMERIPSVRRIAIYNAEGKLVESFSKPSDDGPLPPAPVHFTAQPQAQWHGPYLHIVRPIVVVDETVGWMEVVVASEHLKSMFVRTLIVAGIFGILATLVALFIAWRMQAILFRPLDRVVKAMERIGQTGDYSARLLPRTNDEFGRMKRAFNSMVSEIEQREVKLANTLQDLSHARDQAEAANIAKSEFLASMSHELRTPLNAIIAYTELVEEELEVTGEKATLADVKVIHNSAVHLLTLINDLLDFSKIEAGGATLDLGPVNLNCLMNGVVSTLEPLARKRNNQLVLQMPDIIPPMLADEVKLRQCLLNLGSNACKFTDDGFIVISATLMEGEDGKQEVRITVSDNGIGMDASQLDRLFHPFVQVDSHARYREGGTGLGLAITKTYVEMMQGTISVTSEANVGSVFTIQLPYRPGIAGREELTALPHANARSESRIALVVDNDPEFTVLIDQYLTDAGYEVHISNDGLDGLYFAKFIRPSVIFINLNMPGMSGHSMMENVRKDPGLASVPVVTVSAENRSEGCFALGATACLQKPLDWQHLSMILAALEDVRGAVVLLKGFDQSDKERYSRTLCQAGAQVVEESTIGTLKADLILADLPSVALRHVGLCNSAGDNVPIVAIDTHAPQGSTLDLLGVTRFVGKAGLTPSRLILELHAALQEKRQRTTVSAIATRAG